MVMIGGSRLKFLHHRITWPRKLSSPLHFGERKSESFFLKDLNSILFPEVSLSFQLSFFLSLIVP